MSPSGARRSPVTAAQTVTGPAHAPRPTSSTPATTLAPVVARRERSTVWVGGSYGMADPDYADRGPARHPGSPSGRKPPARSSRIAPTRGSGTISPPTDSRRYRRIPSLAHTLDRSVITAGTASSAYGGLRREERCHIPLLLGCPSMEQAQSGRSAGSTTPPGTTRRKHPGRGTSHSRSTDRRAGPGRVYFALWAKGHRSRAPYRTANVHEQAQAPGLCDRRTGNGRARRRSRRPRSRRAASARPPDEDGRTDGRGETHIRADATVRHSGARADGGPRVFGLFPSPSQAAARSRRLPGRRSRGRGPASHVPAPTGRQYR